MPNTSIYERDLTTIYTPTITTNTVYIPGYANIGPVNTPLEFRSLNEFQKVFGTMPYVFRNSVAYTSCGFDSKYGGNLVIANTKEKSFIEATDLLSQGLPVIFERVMTDNNIASCTAEVTNGQLVVSAKYPGIYGGFITYTVVAKSSAPSNKDYVLNAYLLKSNTNATATGITLTGLGIEDATEEIEFSLDPSKENYIENIDAKIVKLSISGNTSIVDTINPVALTFSNYTIANDEFDVVELYKSMAGYNQTTNNNGTPDNSSDDFITYGVATSLFEKFTDKRAYNIKFITSGAYPVLECTKFKYTQIDTTSPFSGKSISETMCLVAGMAGDVTALIDHSNITDRKLVGTDTVYGSVLDTVTSVLANELPFIVREDLVEDARKYGAMTTPWGIDKSLVYTSETFTMPGSYAYLTRLANSVKTNPNWLAVAGVARALMPTTYKPAQVITGAVADKLQTRAGFSINPIININPYGYCIWGNRTLNYNVDKDGDGDGLVASSFLNVRNLTNDIKKVIRAATDTLTFENNSDVLWLNFKSKIEPTLDRMKTGNGLIDYKIRRVETTKRATVTAVIRLTVVEAVEDFDITIELTDSYVSVE